jgi:hypothetical protein
MFNGRDSKFVADVRGDLAKNSKKLAYETQLRIQKAADMSKNLADKRALDSQLRALENAVESYFTEEDFKGAEEACRAGIDVARLAGNSVSEKKLKARLIEIKIALELKPAVDTAIFTLSVTPGDKGANLVLGRFLCFVKQDWENGLPMLAVAADAYPLYRPAQWDSRNPLSAQARIDVADRWFNLTDEGYPGMERAPLGEQAAIRRRALLWYRSALQTPHELLPGFDRVKAQRRVEQLSGKY